jgi:hypothetical protein
LSEKCQIVDLNRVWTQAITLTLITSLLADIAQRRIVSWILIPVFVGCDAARESNGRVVHDVVDARISHISELAILNSSIGTRGACAYEYSSKK